MLIVIIDNIIVDLYFAFYSAYSNNKKTSYVLLCEILGEILEIFQS